jgi:hypothetical protein
MRSSILDFRRISEIFRISFVERGFDLLNLPLIQVNACTHRLRGKARLGVIHRLGELFELGLVVNPNGQYFGHGVIVSYISAGSDSGIVNWRKTHGQKQNRM